MTTFNVRCFDSTTQEVRSHAVEADSESAARSAVSAYGCVVLEIRASPSKSVSWSVEPKWASRQAYSLLCRELKTLLHAGMTVVEAVDTLTAKDREANSADRLSARILAALKQGKSLSAALQGLPAAPSVLVAAVRAGERTSNLKEALDDYLKFHDLVEHLRRKVVSAAIYPGIVMTLGLTISVFLLLVVLPNFARMYENLRGSASGGTAFMISLSGWVSHNRAETAVLLLAAVAFLVWAGLSGRMSRWALELSQQVPWLKSRIADFRLAMMYQALALLLRGGYSMPEAMNVASASALSGDVEQSLTSARARIEQGGLVSQALADAGLADEVGRRLLAAAERNGEFHRAAEVVGRLHAERFEVFVERMTRVAEPVLLMLVAIMVGGIVVMMYLPVFDMATQLR